MVDFSQERECGWFKWVALREGEEQVECSGCIRSSFGSLD